MSITIILIILIVWSILGFLDFKNWVRYTATNHLEDHNPYMLYLRILLSGPVAWFTALVAFMAAYI